MKKLCMVLRRLLIVDALILCLLTLYYSLRLFGNTVEMISEVVWWCVFVFIALSVLLIPTYGVVYHFAGKPVELAMPRKTKRIICFVPLVVFLLFWVVFAVTTVCIERGSEGYMALMYSGFIPLWSSVLTEIAGCGKDAIFDTK